MGLLLFSNFEKAFNSVEWNFLFKALEKLGFGINSKNWWKFYIKIPHLDFKKWMDLKEMSTESSNSSRMPYMYICNFTSISVEILSERIKNNKLSRGLKLEDFNYTEWERNIRIDFNIRIHFYLFHNSLLVYSLYVFSSHWANFMLILANYSCVRMPTEAHLW